MYVRPWKLFSKLSMFGLFVPWRLGELDVGFVVDDVDAAVDELACLVADGVDDLLLAVAQADDAYAAGEVDQGVPVDVCYQRAL
jgi:hypothetical protein